MYRGQCGACHTLTGYRALNRLLAEEIRNPSATCSTCSISTSGFRIQPLHAALTGKPEEIDALRDYLYAQANPGAVTAKPDNKLTAQK